MAGAILINNTINRKRKTERTIYNTTKDPQWYAVQESDTTMMPNAS